MINFPMYTISTVVLYNIDKCEKEDCDILSVHLPDILGEVICGTNIIICKPNVKSSHCVRKTAKDYLALSLVIDVEPFNVIFPTLNSTACDVNCQVRMYSNVLSIITKNTESFQKMPVFFQMVYRNASLKPLDEEKKRSKYEIVTEMPKLLISCRPGFGLNSNLPHLCGKSFNLFSV